VTKHVTPGHLSAMCLVGEYKLREFIALDNFSDMSDILNKTNIVCN